MSGEAWNDIVSIVFKGSMVLGLAGVVVIRIQITISDLEIFYRNYVEL